jgi:hypothetical protein
MGSVDCPDGLARCVGGVVEASRLFSHPEPCSGSREACECPWDRLGACPTGCVAEDVEVVLPRARASNQLCAPPADAVYAVHEVVDTPAPALPTETGLDCSDQRYLCHEGQVLACEPTVRVVARCVKGCAVEGLTLDDDTLADPAALAFLCLR